MTVSTDNTEVMIINYDDKQVDISMMMMNIHMLMIICAIYVLLDLNT